MSHPLLSCFLLISLSTPLQTIFRLKAEAVFPIATYAWRTTSLAKWRGQSPAEFPPPFLRLLMTYPEACSVEISMPYVAYCGLSWRSVLKYLMEGRVELFPP